jgi:glucosamine--fructose-6-phosphate aminotransferase (isomerizing)
VTIELPVGREESYAQTRSFASMLVATQATAALVADDPGMLGDLRRLPALASPLMGRAEPLAKRLGADETIKRITFLGSGPVYGLANEATVKCKEMSLSMAEAYHFMEFRHGPMSLVDGEHLIVALMSDATRSYELSVLRDLRERGARVVAVANRADDLSDACEAWLSLDADVAEGARPVLYLPFVQLFAYYRSMSRGLNPDRPRNVVMAIRLAGTEMTS